MTGSSPDATDWRILDVLRRHGRMGYAEPARAVNMSVGAITERVHRLEVAGVVSGHAAVIDPEHVGLPVPAFVRQQYPHGNDQPFRELLETTPEILEAHHITGDDCLVPFVLKDAARSMKHLEEVYGRIGALGAVTTGVVYSSPLARRPVSRRPAARDRRPVTAPPGGFSSVRGAGRSSPSGP
ncbi:AsnC family transcriptional regulator [Streptomyces sp. SID8375]|uniref:Lrp/AsnC family transcriptional regulator n=1 Tax=unclassified Streptomyces TaxID=2593676 RepID=UPI00035DD84C|nr:MULTISPECIES: Lrp/AsnC family transcriptional regulator [unclassified Streptomyces]MYX08607.1 AsnC family transcriptional regulator [Streptomyces sp. SID8375]